MDRSDITFDSGGQRCAAWLYRPEDSDVDVPCVVLAHGWTGVREQRLGAFAERFCAEGLAALVFDYRHFGASEGEPRQLADIKRQLADWEAAIAYARSLDGVDPERIVLWGTSFSGAHVMTTATRDHRLAAAIVQVPFTDGLINLIKLGKLHTLRLTREGLRDQLGALRGRPPHMIASVGPPGSLSVMNSPDAEPGFWAATPPGYEWPNEAAARVTLRVSGYRPGRHAKDIRCPILFCVGDRDVTTPPEPAIKAAMAAPRGELRRYPVAHFEGYVGEWFERFTADQVDFLRRHGLTCDAVAEGAPQASEAASPS